MDYNSKYNKTESLYQNTDMNHLSHLNNSKNLDDSIEIVKVPLHKLPKTQRKRAFLNQSADFCFTLQNLVNHDNKTLVLPEINPQKIS